MLHKRREVPVAFAVFDVLALNGKPTMQLPYVERRQLLESLDLAGGLWFLPPVLDDGALRGRVRAGPGGVVAKPLRSTYRTGEPLARPARLGRS
jgi:bifunctional non-homologous end joining protein LigD